MSELAQLKELVPFLSNPNPQVRQLALSNLLQHTLPSSPHRAALFLSPPAGGDASAKGPISTIKLLCRDQTMVAHDAFKALVNLSDATLVKRECADDEFLVFLVSYIVNPTSVLSSLAAMVLSNLTSSPLIVSSLSTLVVPFVPLVPVPSASPPQLSTYYLPSSRCASATPPANMPTGQVEVTIEYVACVGLLVEAFCQGAYVGDTEEEMKKNVMARKGDCHFLATVFANLSTLPPIRQALLSPAPQYPIHPSYTPPPADALIASESVLSKLLIFTEHRDTIRRGGVLSALKHVAMSAQTHALLITPETETVLVPHLLDNPQTHDGPLTDTEVRGVDVLPKILGPLMGGEDIDIDEMEKLPAVLQFQPEDKQREPDAVLRLTCVEVLLLLCTTLSGRQHLRDNGAYTVVKFAHLAEQDQKIKDQMTRLVGLLQREEGADTRIEDLSSSAAGSGDGDVAMDGGAGEEESDDEVGVIEVL